MVTSPDGLVTNRLIDSLPSTVRERLLRHCVTVELQFGSIICEADTPFNHVYFPLNGFISLVAVVSQHLPLEMGLIGSEGMLGATLALGINAVPLRAVVQGPGMALKLRADRFRKLVQEHPALRRLLGRYLYVLMAQLSQVAICTRFHDVEHRLARWLLMTHDRAHADHFKLTHDFLAGMLGVRRGGISTAAGALQALGLIEYSRGDITVVDREGLEAAACECYAALVKDYEALQR